MHPFPMAFTERRMSILCTNAELRCFHSTQESRHRAARCRHLILREMASMQGWITALLSASEALENVWSSCMIMMTMSFGCTGTGWNEALPCSSLLSRASLRMETRASYCSTTHLTRFFRSGFFSVRINSKHKPHRTRDRTKPE